MKIIFKDKTSSTELDLSRVLFHHSDLGTIRCAIKRTLGYGLACSLADDGKVEPDQDIRGIVTFYCMVDGAPHTEEVTLAIHCKYVAWQVIENFAVHVADTHAQIVNPARVVRIN